MAVWIVRADPTQLANMREQCAADQTEVRQRIFVVLIINQLVTSCTSPGTADARQSLSECRVGDFQSGEDFIPVQTGDNERRYTTRGWRQRVDK